MAILVTGAAGFVGVNIVEALLERGDDVVSFDAGEMPPGAHTAFGPRGHRQRTSLVDASIRGAWSMRHG